MYLYPEHTILSTAYMTTWAGKYMFGCTVFAVVVVVAVVGVEIYPIFVVHTLVCVYTWAGTRCMA